MNPRTTSALLFHHVGPRRSGIPPSLTVDPVRFDRLLAALERRGYKGVSCRDWLAARQQEEPAPPDKMVILTFDDGYADLMTFALPSLRRTGFRATAFVVGGRLGGWNSWDDPTEGGAHRLMSSDDVRQWVGEGMDIGGHGMTHVDLTQVDPSVLPYEVDEARQVLVETIGAPVVAFAYPFGRHTPAVRAAVSQSYEVAFGTEEGRNPPGGDPFQLRRTMVQPGDCVVDVLFRARLGWSPLQRLRATGRPRQRIRAVRERLPQFSAMPRPTWRR